MAKKKIPSEPSTAEALPAPLFTGTACTVVRVDPLLSKAYSLEIVDGVVMSVQQISRSSNGSAYTIGDCAKVFWKMLRGGR